MDPLAIVVVAVLVVAALFFVLLLRHRGGAQGSDAARSRVPGLLRRAIGTSLDRGTWDAIEEALLSADVGVEATAEVVEALRKRPPTELGDAVEQLKEALVAEMSGRDRELTLAGKPAVMLVIGVNGTGKTTTIAKLTHHLLESGKSVVLGAADTFRAGAGAQIAVWGERLGVRVVGGHEGGDPASVAYDTVESARSSGTDVVIIDTAGRLHGQRNLMAELEKIHRVAGGEDVDEVLLILDASLGQNGLVQATQFSAAVPVTGVVLTKMDGTAKGGIVIAVERQLGVPVKFVGRGEGLGDLQPFDPDTFVDELLELR